MNKLYHLFHVSDYKGGELHSDINLTLKDVAELVTEYCEWEDFKELAADSVANIPDEEFYKMSRLELLNITSDNLLEHIANKILYPGNLYAFDTYSDYECYTTNSKGELILINPIKEEGFITALRKELKEMFKYDE